MFKKDNEMNFQKLDYFPRRYQHNDQRKVKSWLKSQFEIVKAKNAAPPRIWRPIVSISLNNALRIYLWLVPRIEAGDKSRNVTTDR